MARDHDRAGHGVRARLAGDDWGVGPGLARDESRSAALLSSILSSPTDYALAATDVQGLITLWSRGAASLYGYEAPAVVGRLTWWDLCAEPQEPPAPLDEALRKGSWSGTVTRVRLSGERFPARIVITPLRDDYGRHTGFLAMSRDVSAETSQVAALEEARYAARSLFDANAAPLVTTDLLGVITDVNHPAEVLAGIGREQAIGTSITGYATDQERARSTLAAVLREGKVAGQELTLRRPDGAEVGVLLSASTVTGTDGKPRSLLATIVDLTEQRRLREQLRRSQAYYRDVIAAAADGLVVVDADGVIRDVTPQVCALAGYDRDQLVGTRFADTFQDSASAQDLLHRALAGGAAPAELRLVTVADAVKRVDASVSLLREAGEDGGRMLAVSVRNVTEQAALRDRLARERAYNRGVIEASANGVAITDLSYTVTDVNGTMCAMSGRSRPELLGADVRSCFADARVAAAVLRQALSAGAVTGVELPLAGAGLAPALVNVSVLRGPGNDPDGLVISVRDISELARLRQDLAAQEAYTRAVVESSIIGLFTVGEDDIITDVNRAACELTGLPRRRLLRRRFSRMFRDAAAAAAATAAAFENGAVLGGELDLVRHGVPDVVVRLYAGAFIDPRSGARRLIAALPDVTREKAVEEELRLYSESLYRATMDALAITDPVGVITDVNEQMEQLTGRSRAELAGTSIETCFTDPARAHEFVNAVLREGKVADFELTVRRPDGRATVLWYSAATFGDTEGKLSGIFFSARDITERKRFENMQASMLERARELDQAKSEFVSRVSHELRSPLTSVLGYVELLAAGGPGPLTPDQRRMLEVIDRNGRRLLALIEDLLLLSRIEAGPVPLARERVDVGALIHTVHEAFLPAIGRGQLRCRVDVTPGVALVGDPGQLERVLANLLSNAVKFTPPGGRITISSRPEGDEVVIAVSDTGIGVPEDEQPHLFGRFFRSSISAERETQGTGLGLYIVKHVVEAHGGSVAVSSAPGAGSTFTIRLPARRAHAVARGRGNGSEERA